LRLTIVAGASGLGAAVTRPRKTEHLVLEGYAPGGQAGSLVFDAKISSAFHRSQRGDLTYRGPAASISFRAKFSTPSTALSLAIHDGEEYRAGLQIEGCSPPWRSKCVVIATGADYRRLEAEGREEFENAGVYYAATALEGQLCRGAT